MVHVDSTVKCGMDVIIEWVNNLYVDGACTPELLPCFDYIDMDHLFLSFLDNPSISDSNYNKSNIRCSINEEMLIHVSIQKINLLFVQ